MSSDSEAANELVILRLHLDSDEEPEEVFMDPEDEYRPRILASVRSIQRLTSERNHAEERVRKLNSTLRQCRREYLRELQVHRARANELLRAAQRTAEPDAEPESTPVRTEAAQKERQVFYFTPSQYLDEETKEIVVAEVEAAKAGFNKQLLTHLDELRAHDGNSPKKALTTPQTVASGVAAAMPRFSDRERGQAAELTLEQLLNWVPAAQLHDFAWRLAERCNLKIADAGETAPSTDDSARAGAAQAELDEAQGQLHEAQARAALMEETMRRERDESAQRIVALKRELAALKEELAAAQAASADAEALAAERAGAAKCANCAEAAALLASARALNAQLEADLARRQSIWDSERETLSSLAQVQKQQLQDKELASQRREAYWKERVAKLEEQLAKALQAAGSEKSSGRAQPSARETSTHRRYPERARSAERTGIDRKKLLHNEHREAHALLEEMRRARVAAEESKLMQTGMIKTAREHAPSIDESAPSGVVQTLLGGYVPRQVGRRHRGSIQLQGRLRGTGLDISFEGEESENGLRRSASTSEGIPMRSAYASDGFARFTARRDETPRMSPRVKSPFASPRSPRRGSPIGAHASVVPRLALDPRMTMSMTNFRIAGASPHSRTPHTPAVTGTPAPLTVRQLDTHRTARKAHQGKPLPQSLPAAMSLRADRVLPKLVKPPLGPSAFEMQAKAERVRPSAPSMHSRTWVQPQSIKTVIVPGEEQPRVLVQADFPQPQRTVRSGFMKGTFRRH